MASADSLSLIFAQLNVNNSTIETVGKAVQRFDERLAGLSNEINNVVGQVVQPMQDKVDAMEAKMKTLDTSMKSIAASAASTAADSSNARASSLSLYKDATAKKFESHYFAVKGWVDWSSDQSREESKHTVDQTLGFWNEILRVAGDRAACVDAQKTRENFENKVLITQFSVFFSKDATFGAKMDFIKFVKTNLSVWQGANIKYMIEVTPERQGVRNAAGRMWSWLRSKPFTDVQIKAQYGAKVYFYFVCEGLRSLLFASFINPETWLETLSRCT